MWRATLNLSNSTFSPQKMSLFWKFPKMPKKKVGQIPILFPYTKFGLSNVTSTFSHFFLFFEPFILYRLKWNVIQFSVLLVFVISKFFWFSHFIVKLIRIFLLWTLIWWISSKDIKLKSEQLLSFTFFEISKKKKCFYDHLRKKYHIWQV